MYIEEAITEHFGKRCEGEPNSNCPVCKAWAEYDNLLQELSDYKKAAEAEAIAGDEARKELRKFK